MISWAIEIFQPMLFLRAQLSGFLIFAGLITSEQIGNAQTAANFSYANVERAIRSGDFTSAQSELQARLKSSPADGQAHLLLGIVLGERKELAEAEKQFQSAARYLPSDSAPHTNLGNLLAGQGRFAEAIKQFRLALALNPSDVTSLTNLGSVELAARQYAAALESFESALRFDSSDVTAQMGVLQAELRLRQFQEARVIADRLLQSASTKEQAVEAIGALQAEAGDSSGAVKTFQRGLTLFPQSTAIQFNLGLAMQKSGDMRGAQAVLERLRQQSDTAELENLLGSVYEGAARYLEAVRSYQKAAEMDPANESYRFDYAVELILHLNFAAARLVAEPATRDFPQSARMRVAQGVALFGLERGKEAQTLFLETAQKFPDSELALTYLTLAPDATLIPIPETQGLLESFRKRHPDRSMAPYLMGRLKLSNNDPASAVPLLEASLRLNDEYAPAHLELGKALAGIGKDDDAIKHFRRALELDSTQTESWYRLTLAYYKTGQKQLAAEAKDQFQQHGQVSGRPDLVQTFLYSVR